MKKKQSIHMLDAIARSTRERIEKRKAELPWDQLLQNWKQSPRTPLRFSQLFVDPALHVIAEVKLASPSQGPIASLDPVDVARQYLANGARALSVLTEPQYFHGDLEFLRKIRSVFPSAPILQKDFIVDPYQLYEAALAGADAILLIVALLEPIVLQELFHQAKGIGLSVLVEVHNRSELDLAVNMGADLIGINNRNLKDLSVSLSTTLDLLPHCPSHIPVICESGIETHQELCDMQAAGCRGFLVGTRLMREGKPGLALASLLHG